MLSRAERSEPHISFHHRHHTWIFFQAPNTTWRLLRTRRQRSGTGFEVTMPVWPRTSSVLISVLRHVLQDVTYTILSMIPSPRPSRHKPARQPDPIASLSPSLGEGFVPVARGGTGARRYERTPAQLRHPQARAATPRGRKQRQIAATSALRMLPTARAPAWLRQPVAPGRTSTAQYASCCGRQWSARPFFRAHHSRGTANAPAWGDPGLLRRPRR